MDTSLKNPGVYKATNGIHEVIVLVEGTFPFLNIKGAFDLTRFVKESGMIYGNDTVLKHIKNNPSEYLYTPITTTTIILTETLQQLPAITVEVSNEELIDWDLKFRTLGQIALQMYIMSKRGLTANEALQYVQAFKKKKSYADDNLGGQAS